MNFMNLFSEETLEDKVDKLRKDEKIKIKKENVDEFLNLLKNEDITYSFSVSKDSKYYIFERDIA